MPASGGRVHKMLGSAIRKKPRFHRISGLQSYWSPYAWQALRFSDCHPDNELMTTKAARFPRTAFSNLPPLMGRNMLFLVVFNSLFLALVMAKPVHGAALIEADLWCLVLSSVVSVW